MVVMHPDTPASIIWITTQEASHGGMIHWRALSVNGQITWCGKLRPVARKVELMDRNANARRARPKVAIIGSGISGLSAAWLLNGRYDISVFEKDQRVGGHANTVLVPGPQGDTPSHTPVDMGFIVYNEANYPNLVALFAHLGVETNESDMSFSASLQGGRIEYSGDSLSSLFAQRSNLFRPRFWAMLRDLVRFYRQAPRDLARLNGSALSLGDYLDDGAYGAAFREDHLLPIAAAIWSAPVGRILDYPAASFIRFHENHGLLKISGRPLWRTVSGGSHVYLSKLTQTFAGQIYRGRAAAGVRRSAMGVDVLDSFGQREMFDHVIFACHADQALALLDDASSTEQQLLGAFRYSHNLAYLHRDENLMPKRRAVWSSWNYLALESAAPQQELTVTYWMNRLQAIDNANPLFVTLNPACAPRSETIIAQQSYEHPTFDASAMAAQGELWRRQGEGNVWFCGAHFGSGFHEDGLQSGLCVAEAISGLKRPWRIDDENARMPEGAPGTWRKPLDVAA